MFVEKELNFKIRIIYKEQNGATIESLTNAGLKAAVYYHYLCCAVGVKKHERESFNKILYAARGNT